MMVFRSFEEMKAHLQACIDDALLREVADEVRRTEQKAIDELVYDVYDPVVYERRDMAGGLIADENIQASLVQSGTLSVDNVTPLNPDYPIGWSEDNPAAKRLGIGLTVAVATGRGYDIPKPEYAYPRDFIQKTRDDLKSGGELAKALKKGLRRQGIDTP